MRTIVLSFCAGAALLCAGCGGREPAVPEVPQAVQVTLSDAAAEMLAYADAHDGTVDRVVEDCVTCRLHMKGSPDRTAVVNDYIFHLCSGRCVQSVLQDPEAVLMRIERE